MGLIYMRTSPSGGRYIGQTSRTEAERWKEHCGEARHPNWHTYNTALSRAIRKYGEDSFSVQILEDNIPNELLDEREIYWIKYYNTYSDDNKRDYNLTNGGGGTKLDGTRFLDDWNNGLSLHEICNKYNNTKGTISRYLKYLGVAGEEIQSRGHKYAGITYMKGVPQSDKFYPLWLEGKGVKEIADLTGNNDYTVSRQLKTIYGVSQDEILQRAHQKVAEKRKKPVLQYALTGEYIREWTSACDAARELNIIPGSICNCCLGKLKTAYGYIWRYKD